MTELWILDLDNFDIDKEEIEKWVSVERRKKADRLKNEAGKKAVIGSEYLLNRVLAEKKEKNMLPKEMEVCSFPLSYKKNKWGAPYFNQNPIYFNWSHSGHYVALALSDHPVGVDIQERKKYKLSIAEKYFPKEIYDTLKLMEKEEQEILFFRFWTLLEGWLKARGSGFYEFEIPDIKDAFSEERGLFLKGRIKERNSKETGWNYQFCEKIEGYELCFVQKSSKMEKIRVDFATLK